MEQVQNAENEAKEQERIAEEQKAKEEEERRKNHLNLQKKEKLIWQIYINQIQKEFFDI